MQRLLLAASIAALTLAMSLPALADRDRHRGYHGAPPHYHYPAHDRYQDRGKHHRKHRHKAHRKHRHEASRRMVEHRYHSRPSRHRDDYRDYRDYRGHTDIPLVSVDGYPLVRIQVNH